MITLQQDASDKLSVTYDEQYIIEKAKRFFKWKKATIERINKLGTKDRDAFINHLYWI